MIYNRPEYWLKKKSLPILAASSSWYSDDALPRSDISRVAFSDNYKPTGSEAYIWDASAAKDGSVMAYITGTELTLVGNGSGYIYANPDSSYAFCEWYSLGNVDNIAMLNTSLVTNMASMFSYCSYLNGLDVSGFDTSNVTNMRYLFYLCDSLSALDVSQWETSQVADMQFMFAHCNGLTSLDVSGWDTSACTDMSFMFFNCSALTSLNISSFNTTSVQTPSGLSDFATWCDALTSITLGENFAQTYNVPEANGSLNRLKTGSLFYVDSYVDTEITGANTVMEAYELQVDHRSSVGMMQNDRLWYMSSVARSTITKITMQTNYTATGNETESWDASRKQDGSVMAYRTGTEIVLTPTQTSKIYANRDSQRMFSDQTATADYFSSLAEIAGMDILETRGIKYADYMFRGCRALASADVSGFDTRIMVDMRAMFDSCTSLSVVDVSRWDTRNVTDMGRMFNECGATSLDVSGFNTRKVTDMDHMFYNCAASYLDVSRWNTAKVTDMNYLFRGYTGTILDVSKWDTSACTDMNHMFYSCPNVTVLDVSGWNTAKVTNMSYLFRSCESVGLLDLSGWNTSLVTNTDYMFRYCTAMKKLDMNGFDNSAITSSLSMFRNCNTGLVIYVSTDAMKTWVESTSNFTSGITVVVGAMPAA